jgi:CheY-like chemotaxis protein/HPt (histidine-containing phosphotransfer) domain-containing protein
LVDAIDRHVSAPALQEQEKLANRCPLKILVADDNATNRKVAELMLKKLGYAAHTAEDGREALAAIAAALWTEPFDAILMDIHMPHMDGFTATQAIHALCEGEAKRRPYIAAMTANAMEGDRELCLAKGMNDYVTKPLRPHDLEHALGRAFAAVGHERAPATASQIASNSPAATPSQAQDFTANTALLAAVSSAVSSAVSAAAPVPAPGLAALTAHDVMDWSRLDELAEFDDDEGSMVREVIESFSGDAHAMVAEVQAAIAARDWPASKRAAHKLKGAAGNLGARAIQDTCGLIEEAALMDDGATCALHSPTLTPMLDATLAALKARRGLRAG